MTLWFNVLMISIIIAMVHGKTITTNTEIKPRWYTYHTFESTNLISVDVYDYYGDTVTVYLNAGEVDSFDSSSSLIHCTDVKYCIVKNLRLSTGSYTLFVYNDHYFTSQKIISTVDYWTLQSEFYHVAAILVVIASCCCTSFCLYRACCHKSRIEKLAEIYELRKSYEMVDLQKRVVEDATLTHQGEETVPSETCVV